jgi:riboflavin synthase
VFTGLVETTGKVAEVRRGDRSIRLGVVAEAPEFAAPVGASVSVNGACLTVERVSGRTLLFTAVHETLGRTTLSDMRQGDLVNLERSLRVGDRLDGHFVLGHVDGVGRLAARRRVGESSVWTVAVPVELMPFMAEKGSVALDGISLTIAAQSADEVQVSLVPHTVAHTTMASRRPGDMVNIECDVLARYVRQLVRTGGVAGEAGDTAGESLYAKMMRAGF